MGTQTVRVLEGHAVHFESRSSEEEAGLVAAAKRGDSGALDTLFHRNSDALFWAAFRITKQKEDAEDVVQDSMLRAFLHIRDFDERSKFSTWLTRIAINSALMLLRKKRSIPEVPDLPDNDPAAEAHQVKAVDPSPTPEQALAQSEREEFLATGIRALRPSIRRALEIRELQEYSVRQTASKMGISIAATKARVFHAKRILRKSLRRKYLARPLVRKCVNQPAATALLDRAAA
jgi:RNA polymerase sigma-70 factor, ECF subfamily